MDSKESTVAKEVRRILEMSDSEVLEEARREYGDRMEQVVAEAKMIFEMARKRKIENDTGATPP